MSTQSLFETDTSEHALSALKERLRQGGVHLDPANLRPKILTVAEELGIPVHTVVEMARTLVDEVYFRTHEALVEIDEDPE